MEIKKIIRDPVHGDLPFSGLETKIMDTAIMQRLRCIRQLGASYLVFPGAVHTRFEHSLGTCFMAKQIMNAVTRNGNVQISDMDQVAIPVAALLHDVTHIPFGHTLEDERRIFPRHDMDPVRLHHLISGSVIGEYLADAGILERVLMLLSPVDIHVPQESYPSQIISHTICADLLDYLRRDAIYCGLNMDYDDRIFRYFQVEDGKLILNLQKDGLFRHDAFSEVIHLLRIRYFLTERVYYHHAKIAAGAMLSRAVERAVNIGFKVDNLFQIGDDALVFLLENQFGSDRVMKHLLSHWKSRALYKRCYVLTDRNLRMEQRKELSDQYHLNLRGERGTAEKKIARASKIPHESVIIYAPPPAMNFKEANVLVKVDSGLARPLDRWKNREIMSLQERFSTLWKFYVLIDPEYSQRFSAISAACRELFGLENELPLIQKGQLSLFSEDIASNNPEE